jgi:uncharacterized membrane protein YhaH (DUF805 family)
MLPFDTRPWAKTVARTVIVVSILAAALGAYFCYDTDQLHISEIAIILLSLLTILPPNIAIVMRKSHQDESSSTMNEARLHTR